MYMCWGEINKSWHNVVILLIVKYLDVFIVKDKMRE